MVFLHLCGPRLPSPYFRPDLDIVSNLESVTLSNRTARGRSIPRLYCWVCLCRERTSLLAVLSLLLVGAALLCASDFILSDIETVTLLLCTHYVSGPGLRVYTCWLLGSPGNPLRKVRAPSGDARASRGRQHGEGTEPWREEPRFLLCLLERKWVS